MRSLIIAAILFQAVDLSKCGKEVIVNLPPTAECPDGKYVVTLDNSKTPPEASYRCKNPVTPSSPSPTAPPSIPPSASPSAPLPSPSATPTPVPIPSATPTPVPSVPPSECFAPCSAFPNLLCPCENTCPASWDHAASSVNVGDDPHFTKQSNTRAKIRVELNSKDVPPACAHRGNQGPCDQWMTCAQKQDKAGYPPISWFAAYPGTGCGMGSVNVQDCQVEHTSRLCDDEEKADDASHGLNPNDCRRPNGWSLQDVIGTGGGEPGVRKICALPPNYVHGARMISVPHKFSYGEWIATPTGFKPKIGTGRQLVVTPRGASPTCHAWNVSLSGASLVE